MAQKREHLEKLLLKLDEWANEEGNEWFKQELFKKFSKISDNSLIEEKIVSIEKYLLIDSNKTIDYSKIENKNARDQLTKDCIEMNRFRVGTIRHNIEFEQYCLFAHFQAEELLNYFFERRHQNNINFVLDELSHFGQNLKEKCSTISRIYYSNKLSAFYNMKFIKYEYYNCLYDLSLLRNKLSHRSSTNKKENELIISKFEQRFQNDKVDIAQLNPYERNLYFDGKVLKFLKQCDWNLVYHAINELTVSIIKNEQINIYRKPTIFNYNKK